MPYFRKSVKNFFVPEKNPTSSFKIGGIFGKKMFRKSFETSLIISLKKDNLAYLAVLRKTFLIGKYSNFNFQKVGVFLGMKKVPEIS